MSKGTLNGDIYLKECIKKRLIPFIEKHHNPEDVLLWMDMETCHYKKSVTDFLTEKGIPFVGKGENAPNVPIARPIEKFWALTKAEYKKRKNPTKNLKDFRNIWRRISLKVAKKSAQALMAEARRNLSVIGYGGVKAPYKK